MFTQRRMPLDWAVTWGELAQSWFNRDYRKLILNQSETCVKYLREIKTNREEMGVESWHHWYPVMAPLASNCGTSRLVFICQEKRSSCAHTGQPRAWLSHNQFMKILWLLFDMWISHLLLRLGTSEFTILIDVTFHILSVSHHTQHLLFVENGMHLLC